jgi:hypothetical protein
MTTTSPEIIPSDKEIDVSKDYEECAEYEETDDFLSFSASAASVLMELENEHSQEPSLYISDVLNRGKTEKIISSTLCAIKSNDKNNKGIDMKLTILDCCSTREGCDGMVKYYLKSEADEKDIMFNEFYTSVVDFLKHKSAKYFIQDIIPHLSILQVVKILPFLQKQIFALSKDFIGNYPFQKIIEFICDKLEMKPKEEQEPEPEPESSREEKDCLIQFSTFLDELLDSLTWKAELSKGTTKSKCVLSFLSSHSVGNNMIQCFLKHFPFSQRSRLLSLLLPYLDDLIDDNTRVFVVQCITKQLVVLSVNDDTSKILFFCLEKTKKFKNMMVKTFMIQCFGLFSVFPSPSSLYPFSPSLAVVKANAQKMLSKTCSYNLLKGLLAFTGEEYLRKIVTFLEEYSEDLINGSINGMNYCNWVKAEMYLLKAERLRDMRIRSENRRREDNNSGCGNSDDPTKVKEKDSSSSLKRKSSDFSHSKPRLPQGELSQKKRTRR